MYVSVGVGSLDGPGEKAVRQPAGVGFFLTCSVSQRATDQTGGRQGVWGLL